MANKLIIKAVEDFITNRDSLWDYNEVIDDFFLNYVKSDEYACMNKDERARCVNSYLELKTFIIKLIEVKELFNHYDNAKSPSAH
jgi:hypothetical protein